MWLSMKTLCQVVSVMVQSAPLVSSLLGAGRGLGSCPAPPFRTDPADLAWPDGCPDWASCCSEYGYCQTRETWELGTVFRDCNGESNGLDLPLR